MDALERGLEPQSKIMIGRLLLKYRNELGENYPKFRTECAKLFRRSESTLKRYEAFAAVASLCFAKSRAVQEALYPIWSAEECFDHTTGDLKPVVKEAINACDGIPEDADSATAEQWAHRFVSTVDAMVRNGRKR